MKKIKMDNAVFSSGYDENDIDQTPTFIRADGELVADTDDSEWSIGKGTGKDLALRITMALNYFKGMTIEEMYSYIKNNKIRV